jgi:CMP-2-keto-3-deoxyoctulosonic acid synthetase
MFNRQLKVFWHYSGALCVHAIRGGENVGIDTSEDLEYAKQWLEKSSMKP